MHECQDKHGCLLGKTVINFERIVRKRRKLFDELSYKYNWKIGSLISNFRIMLKINTKNRVVIININKKKRTTQTQDVDFL